MKFSELQVGDLFVVVDNGIARLHYKTDLYAPDDLSSGDTFKANAIRQNTYCHFQDEQEVYLFIP